MASAKEVKAKTTKVMEAKQVSKRSLWSVRQSRATMTCAEFTLGVKVFTKELNDNSTDPNTAAMGDKLASATVSACSEAERSSLADVAAALEVSIENVKKYLTALQNQVAILEEQIKRGGYILVSPKLHIS